MIETTRDIRDAAEKAELHADALDTLCRLADQDGELGRALSELDPDRIEEQLTAWTMRTGAGRARVDAYRHTAIADARDRYDANEAQAEARGLCTHRRAVTAAPEEPRYEEQRTLTPGQVLCISGCGTVFADSHEHLRACEDPLADPAPLNRAAPAVLTPIEGTKVR
ncbi:hypothetical protein [Streptacidiphilus cavernicola]|uniref:DUF222 domain-containing protein n=1 Tax=Streptacidiphilus cavernicola TaxID=3342716 RepID=A0ABV6VYL7_9ACTN